jgi:tyrosine-specific transport protein
MLLIAGSCIGAGMLGLPIVSGLGGFFPSLLLFFLAWLFMTTSAFLLVEVGSWYTHQANLLTMVERNLGSWGKILCWITYLLLFYALIVAYISGISNLLLSMFSIPSWAGALFFVLLFGGIIVLGIRAVDLCNRTLMLVKLLFFALLIVIGVSTIKPALLLRSAPKYMLAPLPILVISFGFHNMIPSLFGYLQGDVRRLKRTILGGGLLTFALYLIWQILVLGIVPFPILLRSFYLGEEASQAMARIMTSTSLRVFSQGFACFALLTSFLAQSLSLVHFLADGFKTEKKESIPLILLALVPPLIPALISPKLFFAALNFAGGICAVILFGLLPAFMVWIGRYRRANTPPVRETIGGKTTLLCVIAFASFVLILQIISMIHE